MKTLRIIAGILITLCIINVITSCKDKEDEPIPEPIKKPLVDKKDSIFLDNGEYVKATTEFTKEQAEIVFKSKVWRKAKWLIYNTYEIKSFNIMSYCYKFYDNYQYKYLYDYPTQEKMDSNIETAQLANYSIEGKTLMFENADLIPYTIVAVDENRIVLDRLCNRGDYTLSNDFPQEFDKNKSKVRCVLTPWSPRQ